MSLSKSEFLSDVHADNLFEKVVDREYAVTRFKFRWPPSFRQPFESGTGNQAHDAGQTTRLKHSNRITKDEAWKSSKLHGVQTKERKQTNECTVYTDKNDVCPDNSVKKKVHVYFPNEIINEDQSFKRRKLSHTSKGETENKVCELKSDSRITTTPETSSANVHVSEQSGTADNSTDGVNICSHSNDTVQPRLDTEPCYSETAERDDDIDVRRQTTDNEYKYVVNIKHSLATTLDDVGEQVWSGALLLCDYMIHNQGEFKDKVVVELGAGVGLASIVAAMFAKTVYCTDTGEKILSYARDNITTIKQCPTLPLDTCPVHVREVDWCKALSAGKSEHWYNLTVEDMTCITGCDVIIAADVIYDFDLTDAFFNTVTCLFKSHPNKKLYIGLEKRLVFSVHELAVTSPVYNYFRLHLDDLGSGDNDLHLVCEVEEVKLDFPTYFNYSKNSYLEIWKLSPTRR